MSEAYFTGGDSFISTLTADMRSISYNFDIPERSYDLPQIEEVSLGNTAIPRTFFAFGLNHKTAPVEIREKLHVEEAEIPEFLALLGETLSECLILSTCNRTEIYAVSDSPNIDIQYYKDLLIDFKGAQGLVNDDHFFALISCAACQQLLNVATSIDSKIIGDSQILRQLRAAYSHAQSYGFTGKVLNQLLQRAFKLGKQTYNDTSIHDGTVSASLAAVELAIETFGLLREKTALVIGAGEMAGQTAEALASKRVGKLFVTNRTRIHAEEVITSLKKEYEFNGGAIGFENFRSFLPEVDIVISATGSEEPILYSKDFDGQRRETLVVDIAVPRDIDVSVSLCPNILLKNIDDLNLIVDGTRERRLRDLPKVKRMIMHEMVDFLTWYYTLPLMPEYEKTGTKPSKEQTREVLKIKEFLNQNVSEIHRLYARTNGNFNEDLASHFDLVKRLQSMKARAFAAGV
jgi:glutamyl-tRNA reductase